jgi:Lrp/AsnC family leucine-responsive transcriptional regulator
VAGEDFYLLLVRVASPADLERLLQDIRTAANVTTRTTVVLSTPYENRPPRIGPAAAPGPAPGPAAVPAPADTTSA